MKFNRFAPIASISLAGACIVFAVACGQAPSPTATPQSTAPTSTAVAAGAQTPTSVSATTKPASFSTSARESSSTTNACAYRRPNPTPVPPRTTPTPFPTATPVGLTSQPTTVPIPTPSSQLLSLPLPKSVQAWKNAIVFVVVHHGNFDDRQTGLVVDPAGQILTVLNPTESIGSLSVVVPGRGEFPATVVRTDPRTDAALLAIGAHDLTAAPIESTAVKPGEPVTVLSRDPQGSLGLMGRLASPAKNAPGDLFALLDWSSGRIPSVPLGSVVVDPSGQILGLAGTTWAWFGTSFVGGPPGVDQAGVLLGSASALLSGPAPESAITPVGVAYQSGAAGYLIDGPVTRHLLAEPVHEVLQSVGEDQQIAHLGQSTAYVVQNGQGTLLELLYPSPQTLRTSDGQVVGRARLVIFWWNRGDGPDLVLCGADTGHLGAAFVLNSPKPLEDPLHQAPSSSRSIVAPESIPGVPEQPRPVGDLELDLNSYPYAWALSSDHHGYATGQLVTFTFTVKNVTQWPVPLAGMPPSIVISDRANHSTVVTLPGGDQQVTLQPGEQTSFTVTWNQHDASGAPVSPGEYAATALSSGGAHFGVGTGAERFIGPHAWFSIIYSGK